MRYLYPRHARPSFLVMPDLLPRHARLRSGIHQRQLPKKIEYFVTFTILAIFANELKQNVLWQNQ